ncbi:MAG: DUF1573 domain-containing protein [Bacteroidetes bacterium]|nr:DUF1573 domain-containing protein [Bacteroidota bacterium]
MIRYFFSLILFCSSLYTFAQTKKPTTPAPPPTKGQLTFVQTELAFGKIPQWQPVTHTFKFKNTRTKPLYIYNVNRKCGCTTPRWTSGMIQPGDSGEVTITFNAVEAGPFDKEMSVSCNGVVEYVDIEITGTVMPAPMPESFKKEKEE